MAKKAEPKAAEKKSSKVSKEKEVKEKKTIKSKPAELDEEIIHVLSHTEKTITEEAQDHTVRDKLITLYTLQAIDSRIDRICIVRGELPLEVQDLEDEVTGLQTRLSNIEKDIEDIKTESNNKKLFIKDCISLIKRYEEQQNNVRNNREFDSLNKEIQYQKLEIEHSEKIIHDLAKMIETKLIVLESSKEALVERTKDLEEKRAELLDIVSETETDEKQLNEMKENYKKKIEDRLLFSYNRLRGNARNGLAVVSIERDACGGCFNKIPPQRQMEIKQHKKIIVCEYCGRVLVDDAIVKSVELA
jgi:uncharacterized protein